MNEDEGIKKDFLKLEPDIKALKEDVNKEKLLDLNQKLFEEDSAQSQGSNFFSLETQDNSSHSNDDFFEKVPSSDNLKYTQIKKQRSILTVIIGITAKWITQKLQFLKNGFIYGIQAIKNCFKYTFCCIVNRRSRSAGILKSAYI